MHFSLLRQPAKRGLELFGGYADLARKLAVFGFEPGLARTQFAVFVTQRRVHADELLKLRFKAVEFGFHFQFP
jgi:hypothetical protein